LAKLEIEFEFEHAPAETDAPSIKMIARARATTLPGCMRSA
jgi:hypothetical protein